MKKISLIILMFVTLFLSACEKDKENVRLPDTITANTLNNLSASSFVLLMDDAANQFQSFAWSEVDFGFQAVITYTVQVDKKSNNFSAPSDVVSVTNGTTGSIKIGDFNKILLDAELNPEEAVALQFRVKATIHTTVAPVYSNIVEATVTPYATVFPPIYMCGEAVGGWNWNLYTYKELRSSAPSIYETVAYFNNTGQYAYFRFFKQTNWDPVSWNYPYFTGTVSNLFEGQTDGDKNFKFIGTSGYYKITVNMKTKSVSMEAVAEPQMFMTGSGVGTGAWGWNAGEYVQMTWLSNGIFRATAGFINGGAFRFFAQTGWATSYNYPYFAGGTVTNLLENANDGDKNFKVLAATGNYVITVNIIDKIVTMEPAP
ncbi:MAG: SusE domain-containing protein [Bacteroidales bacterium]|nr:SusE domain-containing protein [Bacteroidales bacterium]